MDGDNDGVVTFGLLQVGAPFGAFLGFFGGILGHFGTFGSLWGHSGIRFESFGVHFGGGLGTIWDHLEVI